MPNPFVFTDLRTHDLTASRAFFEAFAGWTVADVDAGPTTVPLLVDDAAQPWGGFTELSPGDDRSAQWVPYLGVDDVDAAATRAVELGATITRPRVDLPPGSAVIVTDPGGATLCLWQAAA